MIVIDSTFLYHFVDPDLRVDILFEKWGKTENGGVNVEIAGVFGGMKKISWKACDKNKNPWKLSWAILSILDYWILLICIAKVLFRIENRLRLLMMCLEVLGEVFSWGY